MAEGSIKGIIYKYALANGLWYINLRLLGTRGVPDSIFFGPKARILFVEFKEEDEKPRKLQKYVHKILKRFKFNVMVIDSAEEGKEEIKSYFEI